MSISAMGSTALKACLPDALFRKLTDSTGQPSQAVTFLDHRLNRLLAIELPHGDRHSLLVERPVSRATLRRALLEGLDPIVHFGKKCVAFEDGPGDGVTVRFADGSTASGDVLVGADGASSALRTQLLPDAKRVETGIVAVRGKLPLTDDVRVLTPQPIMRGPTPILGRRGCFMFCSAIQYGDLDSRDGQRNDAPAGVGDAPADDREEYVMWAFSARRERFAVAGDPDVLDGNALKSAVGKLTGDWHPALRQLVESTDPAVVKTFAVKTSVPVSPWKTRNVTLLGDALHNMPPFRGVGANCALWDAAALRRRLVATDRGDEPLLDALARYEREMIEHGFSAVRTSLRDMARFHCEGVVSRTFTKAFFRTVDHIPALRAAFMQGR